MAKYAIPAIEAVASISMAVLLRPLFLRSVADAFVKSATAVFVLFFFDMLEPRYVVNKMNAT
ncbi:MAG: hypothetical protein KAG66_21335, partial [Methylococcales bacterium]|nr:hypothetical protein [Methylococcales bacterium]